MATVNPSVLTAYNNDVQNFYTKDPVGVNLFPNPIVSISKAATAVVTVPNIAVVISATGTIGTVSGSGTVSAPWVATLTLTTTAGLQTGDIITATADAGTFAAGGVVSVQSITGNKAIVMKKIGGTVPTAGTVTAVSLPATGSLPEGLKDGDAILFTNPGNQFTFASTAGTFVAGEKITQATSGATGIVTNVLPGNLEYTATSGVFNTVNLVTGDFSGATTTPTLVTGMNQLLTAGENGTNVFYVKLATPTTFELYKNPGATTAVNSSTFTTATPYAGQFNTFTVLQTNSLGLFAPIQFPTVATNIGTDIAFDADTGVITLQPDITYLITVQEQPKNYAFNSNYIIVVDLTNDAVLGVPSPIDGTYTFTVTPTVETTYGVYAVRPDEQEWTAPSGVQYATLTVMAVSGYEQ